MQPDAQCDRLLLAEHPGDTTEQTTSHQTELLACGSSRSPAGLFDHLWMLLGSYHFFDGFLNMGSNSCWVIPPASGPERLQGKGDDRR